MGQECWFEIVAPQPGIRSIIVGKDTLGFKVDIHADRPNDHFEGSDTIQDRLSHVISILKMYVGAEARWVDYQTREPISVWDALVALSGLED